MGENRKKDVDDVLEILLTGQAHIKQKLEEKESLLQMVRATLQADDWLRQNELTNLLQDGAKNGRAKPAMIALLHWRHVTIFKQSSKS